MAELKDLIPFTKELSLLYIDENQNFLTTITTALKKVFINVDDANIATLGLDYLKLNSYDIIIVDATSHIMDINSLIKKIRTYNNFQAIIITSQSNSKDDILGLYSLDVSSVILKPFKTSDFLDKIIDTAKTLNYHRSYLTAQLDKVNADLLYERKRLGRLMLKEKTLLNQIDTYKDSAHINKFIYELTKLPSRFALQEALDGSKQSLIYINIDHFEFINSTYGMGKANKLLKETATKLSLYLPKNAILYHITADEFVILLHEPSDSQAKLLSSQIMSLFKESAVEFDGYTHFIVFSIGIDSGSGKKLFINAKSASKEASYFGGNQIVAYNAQSGYMKEQRESLHWIGILQKAFDEDKIFIYYQAIMDNNTQEIKHYEVLCRLMDEKNNLIDANKFIHSAKQVGLITQITKTVIDKAFKFFTNNSYNFSINISMNDLHENYLLDFLEYKCSKYNILPSRVHLEIVEDIISSSTIFLDEQILKLKDSGFHVIIDDFGTDKSAYSRMFDLKAEYIKIDGTFIKKLAGDKAHQLIVKSIINFAKKSNIKTIAEHVETQDVYDIVRELGVDYSQGYFIGKPSLNLE
jgi:diguanylate cyclase (GGDEF)-like protein